MAAAFLLVVGLLGACVPSGSGTASGRGGGRSGDFGGGPTPGATAEAASTPLARPTNPATGLPFGDVRPGAADDAGGSDDLAPGAVPDSTAVIGPGPAAGGDGAGVDASGVPAAVASGTGAPEATAPEAGAPEGGAAGVTAHDVPTSVRLPDFRDKDLADVKEALGVLGVTRIKTVDATGDGRSQLVDSNWKVCTQDPRQGRDMKLSAKITFGVVKQHERCP